MTPRFFRNIIRYIQEKPNAPALLNQQGTMSFGVLGEWIQHIMHLLEDQPKGTVMIIGHKEKRSVAAMLACTALGRPFCFADRSAPPLRMQRIAKTSDSQVILVTDIADKKVFQNAILLDETATLTAVNLPDYHAVSPESVFYIAFTSGSKGEPKGVQITHENFSWLYNWYGPLLAKCQGQHAHVNHASLAFDMGMLDLWPTLGNGRPVIMLDHRNNIITQHNMTLLTGCKNIQAGSWFSTPTMLQIMCTNPDFNTKTLCHLGAFFVGGENVPPALIRELWGRFPDAVVFHAYGPTEVTCITHVHALSKTEVVDGKPMSLGPVRAPNQQLIVDSNGNLTAHGEIDELELSGPQVSPGYLPTNHPANRAFGERNGQPYYRTGDLAHLDQTGALILQGRIDNQLKWNGNRIELDEIERVALNIAFVSEVKCIPVEAAGRITNLLLFIHRTPKSDGSREDVIVGLRQSLPATMTPRDIIFVDQMPLTISGKIDAHSLLSNYNNNTAKGT